MIKKVLLTIISASLFLSLAACSKNRVSQEISRDIFERVKTIVDNEYNKDGKVIKRTNKAPNNQINYTEELFYNDKGFEIKKVLRNPQNEVFSTIEFELDDKGNWKQAVKKDKTGVITGTMEYIFDDKNNLIAFKSKDSTGKVLYEATYTYEFDSKGRKFKRHTHDSNPPTYVQYYYE